MKKLAALLFSLTCLLAAHPAKAEFGTADAVPAATLLLPYFEVDLGNTNGADTLISVNNASATAIVANVVVWTDWGVPSLGFNVYLTGYDVQTIDLRQIFNGVLPVTADDGADPSDFFDPVSGISNQGLLSQDINFPGSTGPCGSSSTLYSAPDPSLATKITNMNRVHTGQSSNLDGKCWGATYGDQIARGYVTVDTVNSCTLSTPADPGYFAGFTTAQNVMWGDVIYVNPSQNTAQGETLVHVEACNGPSYIALNGYGHSCPLAPGDYTFYGRYTGFTATDGREPLATTFAARYQGANKTDLLVWRDTKKTPAKITCGSSPSWFPLADTDLVAFDTEENPTEVCALADGNSPAATSSCFPLATQRTNVRNGNTLAGKMKPPANAGWLFLNLNHTVSGDLLPGVAQAWVIATRTSGDGRLSNGTNAIQLDNALDPDVNIGGGGVLLP